MSCFGGAILNSLLAATERWHHRGAAPVEPGIIKGIGIPKGQTLRACRGRQRKHGRNCATRDSLRKSGRNLSESEGGKIKAAACQTECRPDSHRATLHGMPYPWEKTLFLSLVAKSSPTRIMYVYRVYANVCIYASSASASVAFHLLTRVWPIWVQYW